MSNSDYFSVCQPRVLVVEPHPFQLFDLQNIFFSMGCYRVFPIMNLEDLDALLLNCQESFDLTLFTRGSFNMSDTELAQHLSASGKAGNLIMLTCPTEPGRAQFSCMPDFRHLPLLGVLPKPVMPMALRLLVEPRQSWTPARPT